MKFAWRLDKVLDVKIKQEDILRADVIAITEQAAAVRSMIMLKKAALRKMLSDLRLQDAVVRLKAKQLFLKYVHVSEAEIAKLGQDLKQINEIRAQKIAEVMGVRKMRKGLEKLREKARLEFVEQSHKREQNILDEITTTSYARKVMQVIGSQRKYTLKGNKLARVKS